MRTKIRIGVRQGYRRPLAALGVLLAGGSLAFVASSAGARRPVAFTWLHQRGMTLLNAHGQRVRLRGFDEGGMYEGEDNTLDACRWYWRAPPPTMGADVHGWGLNAVRLFISWADLEPAPPDVAPDGALVHHWNERYVAALDSVVASLQRAHVYLIPAIADGGLSPAFKRVAGGDCEGTGMPAWLFPNARAETVEEGWCRFYSNSPVAGVAEGPLDGFAAAWRFLARRYSGFRALAVIDPMNEPAHDLRCAPADPPRATLDEVYRRVGRAIRAVNPHVVLALEGQNHSNGAAPGITTAGLRNVIYEWHIYPPNWAAGRGPLQAALRVARSLDRPLWIGEFNAYNADDNLNPPLDRHWRRDLAAMMAFVRRNGISWTMENYDGQWSITIPGTNVAKLSLLGALRRG